MAKSVEKRLEEKLRAESEKMRHAPTPQGARVSRPNRSKVYSVRLSAEEQCAIEQIAQAQHLPTSTLVRSWILERLEREHRDAASGKAPRVDAVKA